MGQRHRERGTSIQTMLSVVVAGLETESTSRSSRFVWRRWAWIDVLGVEESCGIAHWIGGKLGTGGMGYRCPLGSRPVLHFGN